MPIPGAVEMYKSPRFLGHLAVSGCLVESGIAPWGVHVVALVSLDWSCLALRPVGGPH